MLPNILCRVKLEESVFHNVNLSTPIITNSIYTIFSWSINRETCIYIFTAITFLIVITISLKTLISVSVCMKASKNLHKNMFNALIRAKMNFFNTNLSGQDYFN